MAGHTDGPPAAAIGGLGLPLQATTRVASETADIQVPANSMAAMVPEILAPGGQATTGAT
ncbi:MAG: hypothetical protein VX752_05320 [Actinomycetota bacterium]|nr:hypothetical protein [Actinomycetota bacterium]